LRRLSQHCQRAAGHRPYSQTQRNLPGRRTPPPPLSFFPPGLDFPQPPLSGTNSPKMEPQQVGNFFITFYFSFFSSWGGTKVGRRDPCLSPRWRRRWRAPPSGIFHWAAREMVLLIPGAYQIARADGFTFRRKIACTRSPRALSTGRVLHQEVGCRSIAYLCDKTSRLILNVHPYFKHKFI